MKTPLEIVIGIEEQLKIVDDSLNKTQVLKLTRYMVHKMRGVIPMYTEFKLNPKWRLYDEAIELAESRLNVSTRTCVAEEYVEKEPIEDGCNCCKQCKEPIEKGFRFCSGECNQYYYR